MLELRPQVPRVLEQVFPFITNAARKLMQEQLCLANDVDYKWTVSGTKISLEHNYKVVVELNKRGRLLCDCGTGVVFLMPCRHILWLLEKLQPRKALPLEAFHQR